MKVLVTGANGFVGSELCAELGRRGHSVRAAVRDTARARELRCDVVALEDFGSESSWANAMAGMDAIVHLAARVHVMSETESDALSAFRRVNVDATAGVARAAARHGVKRFVYVSSIKVNGEATSGAPFRADDPPRPQDPYGVSKWEAEQALRRIAYATGLQVTVLRPPLVYGPGVRGNFLRLLRLIELRAPLPFASVRNQRSMIYNGNLASALLACVTDERAAGNTYLISDGENLSTPDLMTQLAGVMGVRPRLWPLPPAFLNLAGRTIGRSAEIDRLVGSLTVDDSVLRETLQWTPPFTVAEGLRHTANWFCGKNRPGGSVR